MKTHAENIAEYIALGGDARKVKLPEKESLPNRAKVLQMLTQMRKTAPKILPQKSSPKVEQATEKQAEDPTTPAQTPPSKPTFLGLISDYPVQLHEAYTTAFSSWLEICSLKHRLNALPPQEEETAYNLQAQMHGLFQSMDKNRAALRYYLENKAVLPTKSVTDYSNLSPAQLVQKKANLKSLIHKRQQTIAKLVSELPPEDSSDYRKKVEQINRRREKLHAMQLDLEKVCEMLK